jgi:hypothetical protein
LLVAISNLQNSVFSPQELKAIIMEVRRYSRWFAQNNVKTRVTGKAATEPLTISEQAAILIRELAAAQQLNQRALDGLISELEELEARLPRIVITLAALPGNSLKRAIVQWCRKNIAPDILVDFRFNATILGGMVVQYGSHVHDWSFRRQILAARSNFPEVLRHV